MTIESYLDWNDISPKKIGDATEEQRKASAIKDDAAYYIAYFESGLDDFIECVDYSLNKEVFDAILGKASDFNDLFEPCCQSGLLGCYMMSQLPKATYKGIDINRTAISRARARALGNAVNPESFDVADLLRYNQQHEAVVGRYVVNGLNHNVRDDMIEALAGISKNIILAQPVQASDRSIAVPLYERSFNRHGYSVDAVTMPIKSEATGSYVFVIKATKH